MRRPPVASACAAVHRTGVRVPILPVGDGGGGDSDRDADAHPREIGLRVGRGRAGLAVAPSGWCQRPSGPEMWSAASSVATASPIVDARATRGPSSAPEAARSSTVGGGGTGSDAAVGATTPAPHPTTPSIVRAAASVPGAPSDGSAGGARRQWHPGRTAVAPAGAGAPRLAAAADAGGVVGAAPARGVGAPPIRGGTCGDGWALPPWASVASRMVAAAVMAATSRGGLGGWAPPTGMPVETAPRSHRAGAEGSFHVGARAGSARRAPTGDRGGYVESPCVAAAAAAGHKRGKHGAPHGLLWELTRIKSTVLHVPALYRVWNLKSHVHSMLP